MGKSSGAYCFLKDYPNFLKDETIARLCEFPQNLDAVHPDRPGPHGGGCGGHAKARALPWRRILPGGSKSRNANHNFSAEPPYEMQQMRQEMKALLDDLTSRDQRMVLVLVTLVHLADSYAQLNSDTEAITATARGDLCRFNTLHFQQEEGLNTALPYGLREIEAMRTMNTERGGADALFRAGCDGPGRYLLWQKCHQPEQHHLQPQAAAQRERFLSWWVPGSGKSMAAKWELMNVILNTDDDVLICDPEAEFGPVVDAVRGAEHPPCAGQHAACERAGAGKGL